MNAGLNLRTVRPADDECPSAYSEKWWSETKAMIDAGYEDFKRRHPVRTFTMRDQIIADHRAHEQRARRKEAEAVHAN